MLIQKDFNRFENYVSQPETYKTLFEPRSLWDKMSFHLDYDKPPIIEHNCIMAFFITSNTRGKINFPLKFTKLYSHKSQRSWIKMSLTGKHPILLFIERFLFHFVMRSVRRTVIRNFDLNA